MQVANVPKNYDPKAKLHKDLVPYRQDGWIHHPLVVRTEHPQTRFDLNLMYEEGLRQLRKAKRNKDWALYVFAHARPFRLQALLSLTTARPLEATGAYAKIVAGVQPVLKNATYWELVADVWIDLENLSEYSDAIHALFYPEQFDQTKRHPMMSRSERKTFDALPNVVTVYRGCSHESRKGWSWTTDKKVGEWFAQRYEAEGLGGIFLTARCPKAKILALLLSRKESEAVIDPATIQAHQIKYTSRPKSDSAATDEELALIRKLNG